MSNHHFHRSAGPFTILLFYYFISIRFQISQSFFASRTAFFACRLHVEPPILHTRPLHPSMFQRFFCISLCISDSLFCMSAHVFACRPNVSPSNISARTFLQARTAHGNSCPDIPNRPEATTAAWHIAGTRIALLCDASVRHSEPGQASVPPGRPLSIGFRMRHAADELG